jgi:hypothetical protein
MYNLNIISSLSQVPKSLSVKDLVVVILVFIFALAHALTLAFALVFLATIPQFCEFRVALQSTRRPCTSLIC